MIGPDRRTVSPREVLLTALGAGIVTYFVADAIKTHFPAPLNVIQEFQNSENPASLQRRQRILERFTEENPARREALDVFLVQSGCELKAITYNPAQDDVLKVGRGEADTKTVPHHSILIACVERQ